MKIIRIDSEEAQIKDLVVLYYSSMFNQFEEIKSIEHNAGIKENQCNINGLFWNYEDMTVIRVEDLE